jgi:acetyltransferase-like isoleucine patch superfamily enzyme
MYYTYDELLLFKFGRLGTNVLIDKTVQIHNPQELFIGDNSRIDAFCILAGKINIGNNVHLASFCLLNGGKSGLTLEDFTGFAYGVYIFTSTDDYAGESLTNATIPAKYKNIFEKEVIVKKHSIIGSKSTIFPGVIISEGTSVGAMSLVNRNTLPWKIYFGIPAKILGDRSKALLELEKLYLDYK